MNIIDVFCTEISRVSSAYEYIRYRHTITFTIECLLDVKTSQSPDIPATFLEIVPTSYSVARGVAKELFTLMLKVGLKPKYSIYGGIYTNREISFKAINQRNKCKCPLGLRCPDAFKSTIRMTFYSYTIRRKA